MPAADARARLKALLSARAVPLTPNQLSFWAAEQLQPGHPALILNSEWNVSHLSEAGLEGLAAAVRQLVARHVCLRSLFAPGPDGPTLREGVGSELQVLPQECLDDDRTRPFQLESEPPFRVRLYRGKERTRLLFQAHHIACDAWSIHILREELVELLRGGRLADLAVDFPAYARWQAAWLEGTEARAMLREWRHELDSPRQDLRFAPDLSPGRPFSAESLPLKVRPALTARLRERACQEGVSLNALLLALWARVLGERVGYDDVTVAVPSAARGRSGFRQLVGPLFSLLPVRLRLGPELVRQAGQKLQQAQSRQELPFLSVVEELRPRRVQGAFPFTSAALSILPYGHREWTRIETPEMRAEHLPPQFLVGPFDFTLNLLDRGDDLQAWLQYDAGRFRPETATAIASQLQDELESGPRVRPNRPAGERLEQRFQAQAVRTPRQLAVLNAEGQGVTYAELDRWSEQLARDLEGRSPGGPVGLAAFPSARSVAGWLAVLKAGRLCLPLDPGWPEARRQAVLADSGCGVVLGEADLAFRLAETVGPRRPTGELAYLLYTSGSEGVPRGVLGTHAGLLHRVDALQRIAPLGPQDRVLLRTPLGFVDAVTEWFSALACGATLCPYPAVDRPLLEPERLLQFLRESGVTRATFVPSLLGLLLRSPGPWPESLSVCIASGEVLRPDLVELYYARSRPGSVLLNLYGSTECAGDVSWFDTRQLERGAAVVPLGSPLGESEIDLVEDEIWVSGPGLAAGYWNRPELDGRTFGPHPQRGGRWLRTGDHGAWVGGLLEYRGRSDRRAKVRGWRVELQEVEAVLESCPGVREAAVELCQERLLAWVVGPELEPEALESTLRRNLAREMQPAQIRQLEALPRLASGKVDRAQLVGLEGRSLSSRSPRAEGAEEPAWSGMTSLWEEVLQVRPVGPHDNFFQLGGHSLTAVQLIQRLEGELGRRLPPGVLLEAPTPVLLSRKLEQGAASVWINLRSGQAGLPVLYLIPGAWGGTLGLRNLADKLPAGWPVVGLEFEGTASGDRTSLESVAERFVREVRARVGTPCRICGYSMGGLLALEMVRRLGGEVRDLILLDAFGPGIAPVRGINLRNRLLELWTHLQILARSRPRHVLDRLAKIPARYLTQPDTQLLELTLAYLEAQRHQALIPEPFSGRVTLIRLSHRPDWVTDPLLGWSELFPQMEVRTITGLHGPLVLEEPIVDDVALQLAEILNS